MIEKISWRGWNNVYRIWNRTVQLLVLADVGPRIIWYGFDEGENILHEVVPDAGLRGGNQFRLYGGHRLWVSPEVERGFSRQPASRRLASWPVCSFQGRGRRFIAGYQSAEGTGD